MKNSTLRAIVRVAAVSSIALVLQACGGGGGGGSDTSATQDPPSANFAKVSSWHLRDDFAAQLFIGGDEIILCDWATSGGSKPYSLNKGVIIEKSASRTRFKITYPNGQDYFYNANYDNSNLTLVADVDPSSPTGYVRGDWQYTITTSSVSSLGVPNTSGKAFDCGFPLITLSTGWDGSNVDPSTPITMQFDAPLNEASISGINATLTANTGENIPVTYSYDPATYTLTLTPAAALQKVTGYTVSVDGVKDTGNNSWPVVQAMRWKFATTLPVWRQGNVFDGSAQYGDLEFIGNKTDGRYVIDNINQLLYDFDGNVLAGLNPNNPVTVSTPPSRGDSRTKLVGLGLETVNPNGNIDRFSFPVPSYGSINYFLDYSIATNGEVIAIYSSWDDINYVATLYSHRYDPVSKQWTGPNVIYTKSFTIPKYNYWRSAVVTHTSSGKILLLWTEVVEAYPATPYWSDAFFVNAMVYENTGSGYTWNYKGRSADSEFLLDDVGSIGGWVREKQGGIAHLYTNSGVSGYVWGVTYEIGKGWVIDGSQAIYGPSSSQRYAGMGKMDSDGNMQFILVDGIVNCFDPDLSSCPNNTMHYRLEKNNDGSWSIIQGDTIGYARSLNAVFTDSQGGVFVQWYHLDSTVYNAFYLKNYGWVFGVPTSNACTSPFMTKDTGGTLYCVKYTLSQSTLWFFD